MRKNYEQKDIGMMVYVRNNDVNKAMKRLKRKIKNDGLMQEVKERQHFVKKSEKQRLAKKRGEKRWQKKRLKLMEEYGFI